MLVHRKGEKAWLTGLASRPDLAGKKVSLLGALDRERGRYPVEVHTSEEKLRIKPENLCFVEHTELHPTRPGGAGTELGEVKLDREARAKPKGKGRGRCGEVYL